MKNFHHAILIHLVFIIAYNALIIKISQSFDKFFAIIYKSNSSSSASTLSFCFSDKSLIKAEYPNRIFILSKSVFEDTLRFSLEYSLTVQHAHGKRPYAPSPYISALSSFDSLIFINAGFKNISLHAGHTITCVSSAPAGTSKYREKFAFSWLLFMLSS